VVEKVDVKAGQGEKSKKMERPGNVLLRSSKRRRRGRSRYQAFSLCVSVVV
jgi:hypothetical protein